MQGSVSGKLEWFLVLGSSQMRGHCLLPTFVTYYPCPAIKAVTRKQCHSIHTEASIPTRITVTLIDVCKKVNNKREKKTWNNK